MTNDELTKLIGDKVYEIRDRNKELNENIELPSVTAQIAVRATLEILEELNLINLSKK